MAIALWINGAGDMKLQIDDPAVPGTHFVNADGITLHKTTGPAIAWTPPAGSAASAAAALAFVTAAINKLPGNQRNKVASVTLRESDVVITVESTNKRWLLSFDGVTLRNLDQNGTAVAWNPPPGSLASLTAMLDWMRAVLVAVRAVYGA